jgi:hypothetical protein
LCPKGVDPFLSHDALPVIRLLTSVYSIYHAPTYVAVVNDFSFSFQPNTWTAAQCKTAFESLRNFGTVNCTKTILSNFETEFLITITSFPTLNYETNYLENNGDPSSLSFDCYDITTDVTLDVNRCQMTAVSSTGTYPSKLLTFLCSLSFFVFIEGYSFCSNRGVCDFSSGLCLCFRGFTGSACHNFINSTFPVPLIFPYDVLLLNNSQTFNGSILGISSTFVGNSWFNYLEADIRGDTYFKIDGRGNIDMNYGGLVINGLNNTIYTGQTVGSGGLYVYKGGVTVSSGGLNLIQGSLTAINGKIVGGLEVDGTINVTDSMRVVGGVTVKYDGLHITNSGLSVNAGGGTIALGGISVRDGVNVATKGMIISKRGMTISGDGLVISQGGIKIQGVGSKFLVPAGGGLSVVTGGLAVTGNFTVLDKGLVVSSGAVQIISGGLKVEERWEINSGLAISGGLTIHDVGLLVTGGMSVVGSLTSTNRVTVTGGLSVTAGGLSVADNLSIGGSGLAVTGGITLTKGWLSLPSAVTIGNSGAYVTGGVTVKSNGLVVKTMTIPATVYSGGVIVDTTGLSVVGGLVSVTGGVTVGTGGVSILAGGLTLYDIGLVVESVNSKNNGISFGKRLLITGGVSVAAGGITVKAGGIKVASGINVKKTGVSVTDGLSIQTLGLHVTGGLTVNADGVKVVDGSTISLGGVVVTGGVTIRSGGLSITSGSLTVRSAGISSAGLVQVDNNGLFVTTGGMTVKQGGMAAVNGETISVINSGVRVVNGGMSIGSVGMKLSGSYFGKTGVAVIAQGLSVKTGGMVVTNGLTVKFNGLRIVDGGLTVNGNGIGIKGGLTLQNTGLVVSLGSLSVSGDGMSVGGGLSIMNRGIVTTSFSLTGTTAANYFQNGLTIFTNGLVADSGLSVYDQGMFAPSVTVNDDGLRVSGGLSIGGGISVAPSLTVTEGASITGGLYVKSGGVDAPFLTIKKGGLSSDTLKVQNNGLLILKAGMTIQHAGFAVTGGLTVDYANIMSNGLEVQDGAAVYGGTPIYVRADGMVVAKDLTVTGGTALQNAYTTPSDQRLKTNISEIDNSLEIIRRINGVTYNLKMEDENTPLSDRKHFGVLAQEVEKVLPLAVHKLPSSASIKKALEKIKRKEIEESSTSLVELEGNAIDSLELTPYQENDDGEPLKGVDYIALLPVLVNAINRLAREKAERKLRQQQLEQLYSNGEIPLTTPIDDVMELIKSKETSGCVKDKKDGNSLRSSGEDTGCGAIGSVFPQFSCSCLKKYEKEIRYLTGKVKELKEQMASSMKVISS